MNCIEDENLKLGSNAVLIYLLRICKAPIKQNFVKYEILPELLKILFGIGIK